jgi:uncharacterized phage-associated protein
VLKFNFEPEKALTALLYIAQRLIERSVINPKVTPDIHRISKILYFADQKHLARYGRPILGDFFVAMKDGPVPSETYDLIKSVRGDSIICSAGDYGQYFNVKGFLIYPNQNPDLNELSESDLECINESTMENQDLSFGDLRKKSHDLAYDCADRNDHISFKKMAEVGGADKAMLTYITTISENQSHSHKR